MTKGKAAVLGILTFWPPVYLVVLVIRIMSTISERPFSIFPAMRSIGIMIIITTFLMLVLIIYYIGYVHTTDVVEQDKKTMWIVLIIFTHILVMPIFWYLYVWNTPASRRNGRRPGHILRDPEPAAPEPAAPIPMPPLPPVTGRPVTPVSRPQASADDLLPLAPVSVPQAPSDTREPAIPTYVTEEPVDDPDPEPAGHVRRLLAYGLDFSLLFGFPFWGVAVLSFVVDFTASTGAMVLVTGAGVIAGAVNLVFAPRLVGNTIGKALFGIRIQPNDGSERPSVGACLARAIGISIWPATVFLALAGKPHLGDSWANTTVVRKDTSLPLPFSLVAGVVIGFASLFGSVYAVLFAITNTELYDVAHEHIEQRYPGADIDFLPTHVRVVNNQAVLAIGVADGMVGVRCLRTGDGWKVVTSAEVQTVRYAQKVTPPKTEPPRVVRKAPAQPKIPVTAPDPDRETSLDVAAAKALTGRWQVTKCSFGVEWVSGPDREKICQAVTYYAATLDENRDATIQARINDVPKSLDAKFRVRDGGDRLELRYGNKLYHLNFRNRDGRTLKATAEGEGHKLSLTLERLHASAMAEILPGKWRRTKVYRDPAADAPPLEVLRPGQPDPVLEFRADGTFAFSGGEGGLSEAIRSGRWAAKADGGLDLAAAKPLEAEVLRLTDRRLVLAVRRVLPRGKIGFVMSFEKQTTEDVRDHLVGHWKLDCTRLEGRRARALSTASRKRLVKSLGGYLTLKEDGTYARQHEHNGRAIVEQGRWAIDKDGERLVLHPKTKRRKKRRKEVLKVEAIAEHQIFLGLERTGFDWIQLRASLLDSTGMVAAPGTEKRPDGDEPWRPLGEYASIKVTSQRVEIIVSRLRDRLQVRAQMLPEKRMRTPYRCDDDDCRLMMKFHSGKTWDQAYGAGKVIAAARGHEELGKFEAQIDYRKVCGRKHKFIALVFQGEGDIGSRLQDDRLVIEAGDGLCFGTSSLSPPRAGFAPVIKRTPARQGK